jgi:hypothetical protein
MSLEETVVTLAGTLSGSVPVPADGVAEYTGILCRVRTDERHFGRGRV